jgi:ribosomal protein L7Ae-like RNA K-turn-binding protein
VDRVTTQRLLGLVGLGMRARGVVVGVERVRDAAKKEKLAFAIVAPDASRNSVEKVVPLLRARRINFVEGPTAAELGAAVGKEQTAIVGVIDRQLARGMRELLRSSLRDAP